MGDDEHHDAIGSSLDGGCAVGSAVIDPTGLLSRAASLRPSWAHAPVPPCPGGGADAPGGGAGPQAPPPDESGPFTLADELVNDRAGEPADPGAEADDFEPAFADGEHDTPLVLDAIDRATERDDATLAAWLLAVADHDERALAALYEATFSRVHGLVLRITRHAALAEEATEDTYWQVWRQAPRFDPVRGRALAWLLAMARSRAIDALRRDARFRHDELPEDGDVTASHAADPAPPDLLAATRTGSALHAALARLAPLPRQLVALAFLRGLTHEEIAAQCELPLGTVKSQIRRALITLRAWLGEAGLAAGELP